MEFSQHFSNHSKHLQSDLRSPSIARLKRGAIVGWVRVLLLVILDLCAITTAWILAIKLGTPASSYWDILSYPSRLLSILSITISILAARSLYKAGGYRRDYLGIFKALSLTQGLIFLFAFLQDPDHVISRSAFLLSWLFTIAFVFLGRLTFDLGTSLIRKRGAVCYPVYVIYDGDDKERSLRAIQQEGHYSVVGVADATVLDRQNRDETFEFLRKSGVVEVFISWDAIKNRLHLCWHFQRLGITLRILSSLSSQSFFKPEFHSIGGIPSFSLTAPTLLGTDYWIKRYFDLSVALLLLIALSPLYLLIAIWIRFDSPGPIFYRQTRLGLNGKTFKVWKFRTMVADADKLQATLEATNEMKDGVLFKMKDDPRITKLGKFLRAYSLDELPQLINVLVGEMSFVGPRPLPLRDVEKFKESYFIRQEVLPGITGLWQVSGRSDIDNFEDAVNLDFTYIANWSLWLDLQIMLKTVHVVLRKSGAY